MKFLQACTDSSFLSLLVCSSRPFEWGFSPWTNIPTAHKLQTNSPQLKTLKSNNTHTHTHHTWHPCCTSYLSVPILHNHKTEKKLQKTQNRNQFSQIHYTHVFGTPTFPKSWKPKFRKEQQSGSLGKSNQAKECNSSPWKQSPNKVYVIYFSRNWKTQIHKAYYIQSWKSATLTMLFFLSDHQIGQQQ